jgi:hypothetical protein
VISLRHIKMEREIMREITQASFAKLRGLEFILRA